MAIKKANELDFSNKKIAMLILARAGTGKTTLANSAPKPLVVDLENGIDRVESIYRRDTMVCDQTLKDEEKYNSFIYDLTHEDLSDYETIIIDSIGKFIELATPVVIKENPANGQKDGKTLSLKGYGAISTKVSEFIKLIKSLNKNIIFISHVTEINDGEVVKTRINISGSTKDKIWDDIDLGGYMTFVGKKRVIYFTPSEQFDAKGTHGIVGMYEIPELKDGENGGKPEDNHFLSDLFKIYLDNLKGTNCKYEEDKKIYDEAMKLSSTIKEIKTAEELTAMVETLKNTNHALTSEKELKSIFADKVKELGATYDKEAKQYIING